MTLLPVGKPTAPPKKVTHGKEFKGPPFISKPEVVAFKVHVYIPFVLVHSTYTITLYTGWLLLMLTPPTQLLQNFEVGQTYRRKIILTNISYIINYCKLLGISQDLMDFITIR